MEIEADFRSDLIGLCRLRLTSAGFRVIDSVRDKLTGNLTAEPLQPWHYVLQYCNVEHRFVPQRPRTVMKHPSFTCPIENQVGLDLLLRKVEQGGEMMRHGSSRIMFADAFDELLNDWNIHHFHLGAKLGKDGFVNRTKNVLFAWVARDEFYCLDILPHEDGQGRRPWSQQRLIQIVHENWPALLAPYKPPGVLPGSVEPKMSDEDIEKLRAAGVIVPTEMPDGTIYLAIGGGYATSRDSQRAIRRADALLDAVTASEKWLRQNIDTVVTWAQEQGKPLPTKPKFELEMNATHFYALEPTAGVRVKLGERPRRR